ncbi:MAG: TonB-dependent receptor [Bacteroidales bacterium]|jgi:iron complex outermembrane receptor protein|nr:TonB-dependent receptor [Bacteroidales bacterium]
MGPKAGTTVQDNVWQAGEIIKSSVFTEYHIHKERLQLIASGRLEFNHASSGDPDQIFLTVFPNTQAEQLNPGISIGGLYNINEQISTGMWLGRVQQSGSLAERFINYFPVGLDPYEMVGNPKILPEVNNQVDLSIEWKSSKSEIHADFFAGYLQNLISSTIDPTLSPRLPTSPGVRVFDNVSQAFKTGFEVSWIQSLFAGLQHHLSVAYTYGQNLERDDPLPEIAPFDISYLLLGSYFNKKLRPEISYRYVLGQSRISSEYGETTTPTFNLLDTKISYKFGSALSLSTGIKNIFNVAYYEHLSRSVRGTPNPIYSPGRSFFVSFNVQFM